MTRRFCLLLAVCAIVLGAGGVFAAGEYLSAPARRTIGAPPHWLNATTVSLPTGRGAIAGWYARGRPGSASILLLHGVRADRRQMLARAAFLAREDYGVLLIDLQAHGESEGERITFGAREALGVTAALDLLRRDRPNEQIGVIGVSLGAAALVLARPGMAINALVIEAMYPTIEDAVSNRLDQVLGKSGRLLAPLLLLQLPLRADVTLKQLRTIDAVSELACPTLVVGGADDKHTSAEETRRLFSAVRSTRALWMVDAAGHVDFHALAPALYEEKIGAFLRTHLRHQ